jgi:ADP-sugar diphosphatase
MSLVINGSVVEVYGINSEVAIASAIFQDWLKRLAPDFYVRSIEFQSVDIFGPPDKRRVVFIKFKAEAFDAKRERVSGVVFMRGGSVSILPVFHCDDGNTYTILANQARFAVGQIKLPEIPAGMLDGDGNVVGVTIRELQEELGIDVKADELIDLGLPFYGANWPGVYLSPGACDEFIRPFFFERSITLSELDSFRGKLTGLRTESERITLSVIHLLRDLPRVTSDGKSLVSYGLYLARLREAEKVS